MPDLGLAGIHHLVGRTILGRTIPTPSFSPQVSRRSVHDIEQTRQTLADPNGKGGQRRNPVPQSGLLLYIRTIILSLSA